VARGGRTGRPFSCEHKPKPKVHHGGAEKDKSEEGIWQPVFRSFVIVLDSGIVKFWQRHFSENKIPTPDDQIPTAKHPHFCFSLRLHTAAMRSWFLAASASHHHFQLQ
jgi:hypothetical protein